MAISFMNFKRISFLVAVSAAFSIFFGSCQEMEQEGASLENVRVSVGERKVSFRGATIDVTFDAPLAWEARLELIEGEGEWAALKEGYQAGDASKGARVRVVFEANGTAEERVAELWVKMDGYDECICTLTQALSDEASDAAINKALNSYMHDILKKDYLFADAYNEHQVDLTVSYQDFLSTHLLALGKVNEADGGYYKSGRNAGERFIYTNIAEVKTVTKAINTEGLGFGPFISTALADGSTDMGIAPAYVRRGSPADEAGLRRGDLIFGVNGTKLTTANYSNFMTGLYQGASGTYKFDYMRFEPDAAGGYVWNVYLSAPVTSKAYVYDPVLHASVLNDSSNPETRIGYLVYESFDLNSQEFLEDAIGQFVTAGITDLILDLRFNAGGAVAQSRWLSGCIAGKANAEKVFTKVIYNNGKTEDWTFGHGYTSDVDNLGLPVDLGLSRLYVITSYNTASAAELVINSLRGIDFPVYLIGGVTEGKNVGMTVSEVDYGTRRFQFSPVTFWVRNAKDFGDYPDGMMPDEIITETYDNAFPYSFSDWSNMDVNIALQWAYCEITGRQRWNTPLTRSHTSLFMNPTEYQSFEPVPEHMGNLLYKLNKD